MFRIETKVDTTSAQYKENYEKNRAVHLEFKERLEGLGVLPQPALGVSLPIQGSIGAGLHLGRLGECLGGLFILTLVERTRPTIVSAVRALLGPRAGFGRALGLLHVL